MKKLELRDFQRRAVTEITKNIKVAMSLPAQISKVIVLDSPTGSGKTVMLGKIIDEALADSLVLVLSPGAGDLETQTCEKLDAMTVNVAVKKLDNAVLSVPAFAGLTVVSNWEALTTRNRKTNDYKVTLTKQQDGLNLFDWVAAASEQDIPVVVIVDEAHHGASKAAEGIRQFLGDLSSVLKDPKTDKIGGVSPLYIEASATPLRLESNGGFFHREVVSHSEVIKAGLMRKSGSLNAGFVELLGGMDEATRGGIGSENLLLRGAYDRLKLIDAEYAKVGSKYHGLMVIQIPNMAAGNAVIDRAEAFFAKEGITEENGKLAVFTSANKTSDLKDIASPDSPVKVLLYKQAISQGWDCPRAQVIVGFRHLTSKVFTVQNLGRLCRTTEAKHYDNDILDRFYIYSNVSDLGLGLFGGSIADGLPNYAAWGQAKREHVQGFNDLNLPRSHYGRTSRIAVDNATLQRAITKAFYRDENGSSFKNSYQFVNSAEAKDFLYEVTKSTEEIYGDKTVSTESTERKETKRIGQSSAERSRELLDKIETVVTENGRDFGGNSKLAESILRRGTRWVIRNSFDVDGELRSKAGMFLDVIATKEDFDRNDWAVSQLLANFPAFRVVINRALNSKPLKAVSTSIHASIEDAVTKETRELSFLGSYGLSALIPVDRADSKKVGPRLTPYYLYKGEKINPEADVEAWRGETLSGQEQAFEDDFLTSVLDRDEDGIAWFYKNPARGSNDFSFGVSNDTEVLNFFPDYIVAFNVNGEVLHAILEVKPSNVTGQDPNALVKAKAALEYSKKVGIPVAVIHPTSDGQWRVAGTEGVTTLRSFLFDREWTPKEFGYVGRPSGDSAPVPENLSWMKTL